jgi:sulfur-carrier protein
MGKVMKRVTVNYFAVLRERRGLGREDVQTEAATLGALYEELAARHGFNLESKWIKAAVGEEFMPMDARLQEGAEVAFIPPVAGG